jgi:hypothetical protein
MISMVTKSFMILKAGWMLLWILFFGMGDGVFDKPFWTITRNGNYICAATWNFLIRKKDVVDWWNLVWYPMISSA